MSTINNREEARAVVRLIDEGKIVGENKTKALSALRKFERLDRPSSMLQLIDAPAKGFNTGYLADFIGFPVDALNSLLSFAGLDTKAPSSGS